MQLRNRFVTLMALRKFVRDLPPDQAHLFHRIAARYQGSPTEFRENVMREFREGATASPSLPVGDLEIRAAMGYALGRESSAVPEMVGILKEVWSDLQSTTRAMIVSDIETAIAYRMAGGAPEIALWKTILALAETTAEKRATLDELRAAAAKSAYEAHDFGEALIEDHDGWERVTPGDEWTRAIYVRPAGTDGPTDRGHFAVVFEPGTAVVRESYGMLNGELLRPATPSPR